MADGDIFLDTVGAVGSGDEAMDQLRQEMVRCLAVKMDKELMDLATGVFAGSWEDTVKESTTMLSPARSYEPAKTSAIPASVRRTLYPRLFDDDPPDYSSTGPIEEPLPLDVYRQLVAQLEDRRAALVYGLHSRKEDVKEEQADEWHRQLAEVNQQLEVCRRLASVAEEPSGENGSVLQKYQEALRLIAEMALEIEQYPNRHNLVSEELYHEALARVDKLTGVFQDIVNITGGEGLDASGVYDKIRELVAFREEYQIKGVHPVVKLEASLATCEEMGASPETIIAYLRETIAELKEGSCPSRTP